MVGLGTRLGRERNGMFALASVMETEGGGVHVVIASVGWCLRPLPSLSFSVGTWTGGQTACISRSFPPTQWREPSHYLKECVEIVKFHTISVVL